MFDSEKERLTFQSRFPRKFHWIEWSPEKRRYDCFMGLADSACSSYDSMHDVWQARARLAHKETQNLQAEITALKQKLEKIESGEFVLVPRFLNEEKQDAINELIAESVYIETSWGGVNSVDWTQGLDKALYELILDIGEKDHE